VATASSNRLNFDAAIRKTARPRRREAALAKAGNRSKMIQNARLMATRLRMSLCLLLATVVACSGQPSRSAGDAKGEGAWREFRSNHFVLRTDASREEARESLVDFETTYETLRAILFVGDPGGAKPVHVVLFAHGADLRRFIPPGTIAAFLWSPSDDPELPSTMLLETSFSDEARRIFVHEMTHAFIGRTLSHVPLWLNEGLAKYFETMRIESGRVVVGNAIPEFSMAANQMPSLPALLAADASIFYAGRDAHSVEGLHQQTSFYVAAWFLVHMFMHGKADYRGRFHDFLDALKRRESATQAWKRAFDEATLRRLEVDYLEYLRTDPLPAGYVTVDVPIAEKVESMHRVMPTAEVDRLWDRLWRSAARP
jgi:hypothetical protein